MPDRRLRAAGRGVFPLLRLLGLLRYGPRMVWQGMDVFHFDAEGLITGKYSYANFKIPPMKRDRGAPWSTPPRNSLAGKAEQERKQP